MFQPLHVIKTRRVTEPFSGLLSVALTEPTSCALLYPTTRSLPLRSSEFSTPLLKYLFVLDGSWDEAREIFNSSPILQKLQAFHIPHTDFLKGSFCIRKPPISCPLGYTPLCTAEVIGLGLDLVENSGNNRRHLAVSKVLKEYSKQYLSFAKGNIKHCREKPGYDSGLYGSVLDSLD